MWVPVKSSNIKEVQWEEVNGQGQLEIKFNSGKIYRYYGVPKGIYEKLISAPSIGRFFNIYIQDVGYKYEVIGYDLPRDLFRQMENAVAVLEKEGLAIRELDDQGNPRVVFLGEYAKELAEKFK